MKPNFSGFSFDTICTHDDFFTDPIAHIQPIYAGSTFVYESPEKAMDVFAGKEDAFIYARWSNPNAALVEAKITALETLGLSASPKSALLFSTGMAAISAALESVITPNSMVIAQQDMYGATVELLSDLSKRYPFTLVFADFSNATQLSSLLNTSTPLSLVYAEVPSNPLLSVYNLSELSDFAHQNNAVFMVDNTLSTPYIQQPFKWGADVIVYSATKFLNGHGSALGGIVIGDSEFIKSKVLPYRKLRGAMLSATDAWLLNQGLKTLSLRLEKHASNAEYIANHLLNHPAISNVWYPALKQNAEKQYFEKQMKNGGGVLSFELKSGFEACVHFVVKRFNDARFVIVVLITRSRIMS